MWCRIHDEETGERRKAVTRVVLFYAPDEGKVPVCQECRDALAASAAAERTYASQYAYACGYKD